MKLVSIDVGYINMGVAECVVDDEYNVSFTRVFKEDITVPKHIRVQVCDCKIPHTRETCDRVSHFIQEYWDMLDGADTILIERQPLTGLKDIEALIVHTFRDKIILISPNKMHKYFGISYYSYDERKVKTEKIAFPHVYFLDGYMERKHDIADAVCMSLYYANTLKDENKYKRKIERLPFDEYRFDAKVIQ